MSATMIKDTEGRDLVDYTTTVHPDYKKALEDAIELRWKPLLDSRVRLTDVPSCALCAVSEKIETKYVMSICNSCPLFMEYAEKCTRGGQLYSNFTKAHDFGTGTEITKAAQDMLTVLESLLYKHFTNPSKEEKGTNQCHTVTTVTSTREN